MSEYVMSTEGTLTSRLYLNLSSPPWHRMRKCSVYSRLSWPARLHVSTYTHSVHCSLSFVASQCKRLLHIRNVCLCGRRLPFTSSTQIVQDVGKSLIPHLPDRGYIPLKLGLVSLHGRSKLLDGLSYQKRRKIRVYNDKPLPSTMVWTEQCPANWKSAFIYLISEYISGFSLP